MFTHCWRLCTMQAYLCEFVRLCCAHMLRACTMKVIVASKVHQEPKSQANSSLSHCVNKIAGRHRPCPKHDARLYFKNRKSCAGTTHAQMASSAQQAVYYLPHTCCHQASHAGKGKVQTCIHEVAKELPAGGHFKECQVLLLRYPVQCGTGGHAACHSLHNHKISLIKHAHDQDSDSQLDGQKFVGWHHTETHYAAKCMTLASCMERL